MGRFSHEELGFGEGHGDFSYENIGSPSCSPEK